MIIDRAVEDGWLALRRGGVPCDAIAAEAGLGVRRVQLGIAAARRRESEIERARRPSRPVSGPRPRQPRLTLCFGASCKPLAVLTCEDVHRGPIPEGSGCCCGVCHGSGKDRHPAIVLDPRDIPPPEPKVPEKPRPKPTRRQRRLALKIAS